MRRVSSTQEKTHFIPVHTLPMCGENYTFYCDATRVCLGFVLMHGGKVITYASR